MAPVTCAGHADEDEQLLLLEPAVLDEFHHVSFTPMQSCKLVLCGAIGYLGPLQLLCDRSVIKLTQAFVSLMPTD